MAAEDQLLAEAFSADGMHWQATDFPDSPSEEWKSPKVAAEYAEVLRRVQEEWDKGGGCCDICQQFRVIWDYGHDGMMCTKCAKEIMV